MMRKAFEEYFNRLKRYSKEVFGTLPTICYTDDLNADLIASEPDEDNEVEWHPAFQETSVDWGKIEKQIGFRLCDELKEYYSTYSFPVLAGKFGDSNLYFYSVNATESVEQTILREHADAKYIFLEGQLFLLGNAVINDDDGYFIYYDNANQKVFCYETDTGTEFLLAYSLAAVFSRMEASV